jgi:hypothetical protein
MKTMFLAVLLSVCCAIPVTAASLDELTPFLSAQYFTWEEYSGGRRLLKESGPLFSGGILFEVIAPSDTPSALAFRGKGEVFGGIVDYRGETQAPNPVPVNTDVSYVGTRQDLDLGYRYTAGTWFLEPFAGLGYRWWLRGLQDSTSESGQRVSGYTEYWQTGYLRLGARGRYRDASGVSLFAEGGAKHPFYTGNSVDFAGTGVTTFRPQGRWSGFAETGVTYRHLKLALSYEGFRFAASPVLQVGTQRYLQPESSSDILGLNLGWAF